MTFLYLLCFVLLVAGTAFLLELTPEGITDDIMRLIAPKQTLRDKVLIAHGKKKSRRMTKELLHIREALEATGKANQFTAACCASILLMILGCIFAVKVEGIFEGCYGTHIAVSGCDPQRLADFSFMLAGHCDAEDYDTWVNKYDQEQDIGPVLSM